jgi:DNA-binding transcriptional regulator YdaS (Cro superfamily)
MGLKEFLHQLPNEEAREAFATRCGTTLGYLKLIAYGHKHAGEKLAINIERESRQKVRCEALCPHADWNFIRGTKKAKPEKAKAA